MLRLTDRLKRLIHSRQAGPTDTKASAAGPLLGQTASRYAWIGSQPARWTQRRYELLIREGYRKNAIANRCVRLISECAASVEVRLHRGAKKLDSHPMLDLLARPNPLQDGRSLMEAVHSFLQLAGNSFIEVVDGIDGRPEELYVLRPDRMTVVPGHKGWPAHFDYRVGGRTHRFSVDSATGRTPVLHLRQFHPEDDFLGLAPLEAAAAGIDIHNAASEWNKALLDNAARPSGALVFEPGDGRPGHLTEDQVRRLKEQLEDQHQGAGNAGRPFLLEGGLKWQQVAFSPADMEFIQSKHVAAREIALAFGVPPMLLGIPGDNTYANYQEANRAFWRLTVLPAVEKAVATVGNWLAPRFGPDLVLVAERNTIPALAAEQEALWTRLDGAGFLSTEEKRLLAGLGSSPGEIT